MTSLEDAGPGGLNLMSASSVASRIAAGEITSEAVVTDCLARIEARDGALHAWVHVDPDLALRQARARDAADAPAGPLHGVPVGVKDVLDTHDMPTAYGSAIYRGHRPPEDSRCVSALRAAGAVILGKTTTTEFASPIPIGVRNPHDPDRTPGVSSSGSAAAVADFMTPLANGTQTGGSVILPAAFCGIVGYKATLDRLDRTGIRGLKESLDTLGYFARSVEDIALVYRALTGESPPGDAARPAIGVCRTEHWDVAEPCMQAALEGAATALSAAGYRVADVDLPADCQGLESAFRVISSFEGKKATPADVLRRLDETNEWTRGLAASDWSDSDYADALAAATRARFALSALYDEFPVLLTPAAPGEAPADLESPSVSSFNRIWTLMHGPTMSLPAGAGPNGMPLGLQIAARPGEDAPLIARAAAIHEILRERLS